MAYPYYSNGYNFAQTYVPQNYGAAPPVLPQNGQANAPAQAGFSCRPVTSREEAVSAQIPFDGSTTFFVDTANGKIYAKTFNFNDGTAPLVSYVRETVAAPPQYAQVDAVETLRAELDEIKAELENIKKAKKAVKKNDESDE